MYNAKWTTIDNEVINCGIQCTEDTITVNFVTKNPFHGRLFVKGMSDKVECMQSFDNEASSTTQPTMSFGFGACNMHRSRMIDPQPGMMQSIVVVISFHSCAIETVIIGDLTYEPIGNAKAWVDAYVFKFADKPHVFFHCTIQLCNRGDQFCENLTDTVAGEEKPENENFPYFIEDDDHKQLIAKGKHAEVCFTKTAYGVFLLGIVLLCTVLFVSFALLCRQRKLLKTNK
ncbi:Cuticlin-1 [Trichinella pseudospiralis]|uniref:Cuticlin-1 n=1 Tax=Trichinella pseudospiralis TaxID=6337 RepID=A0A0V0XGF8_TRIPS|nr:Cuticlin-1 [Trichinella pseudospiralis]